MSYTGLRFGGRNAVTVRPADKPPATTGNTWARDDSAVGADDGTEIDATWANRVKAVIETAVAGLGGDLNTGDAQLLSAIEAALSERATTAALASALGSKISSGESLLRLVDGDGFVRMTSTERTKLAALATNYRGVFTSLAAVEAAVPTAVAGDYAVLTKGAGSPATIVAWDSDNSPAAWVDVGAAGAAMASLIGVLDIANLFTATTVEAVLAEIMTRVEAVRAEMIGRERTALKNVIINGGMRINQRGSTSVADDAYCFDRWYVLAQSGTVGIGALTNIETGWDAAVRITQSQASAQRFGLAQIIEALNSYCTRGQSVTLRARVRCSASTTLRYAILEWTGTADSPTSDVVNDWTSGAYTAGNFFISTTTTVVAVGSTVLIANTAADITVLTGTVSSGCNNLIVVFWTDSVQAQNVTLDMGRIQLELGSVSTPFEMPPLGTELALCQRYYNGDILVAIGGGAAPMAATRTFRTQVNFPVPFRVTPTMTVLNTLVVFNMTNPGTWSQLTSSRGQFSSQNTSANDADLIAQYAGSAEL